MTLLWLGVLIVAAIVLVMALRSAGDPYAKAEGRRPADLNNARVVESNVALAMTSPFKLHGTPDVVYLTARGTLVVREDKSGLRFPHPAAERIQLSVYAAILRHNPPAALRGVPVEPFGYVRYGTPGRTRVRWQRVALLTDGQLAALVLRYHALARGETPRRTRDRGYCEKVCRHFNRGCSGA